MSVDQDGKDLISELSKVFSQLQLVDSDKAPARAAVVLAGLGFSPEMQAAATRTCCCWTSRPTCWTCRPCYGWSATCSTGPAPSSWSATTGAPSTW